MDIYPGWWFQPTPLKNHRQLVSWDDDIPFPINMMNMESHKKKSMVPVNTKSDQDIIFPYRCCWFIAYENHY